MKIKISDIEKAGIDLDFSEKINQNSLIRTYNPFNAHIKINKQEKEILIYGKVNGTVELQCSRCLKDFHRDLYFEFDLIYQPLAEMTREERNEIHRGEIEIDFYKEDELDISHIVKEQLILNLPLKPLCDEACKGFCPLCGLDMNLEHCECKKEFVDPRLKGLKRLLSNRKE